MNELMRTWRSSLSIFFPANLKLFFLATINAVIKGIQPFMIYVFPMVVLIKLFQINVCHIEDMWCQFLGRKPSLMLIVAVVGAIAAIRPSVNLKKCKYFRAFWFPALVLFLLWTFFLTGFNWALEGISAPVVKSNFIIFGLFILIALPLMILVSYCLFDAPRSIIGMLNGIKKGILFTLYNLPFIFISMLFYFVISLLIYIPTLMFALYFDLPGITVYILPGVLFGLFFILSSWLSILYTKRVYEQYDLIG